MNPHLLPGTLLAALIAALSAAQAAAQTVAGTVVENATGGPVHGAFVRLLDEDGRQRAATMSDTAGEFSFRVPGPGTYTVQVDQIGYVSGSTAVALERGAATRVTIRLDVLAFPLEAVTAVARSRCRVRPESGAETERIWQEARKALDVAAWADRSAVLRYELTTYRRTLDARRRLVVRATEDTAVGLAFRPFETRPADQLMAHGFIQPTHPGEYMFYAPDANVLLSDEFLSTHCFWVETPRRSRHRGMIGLAFEPAYRREVSDVAGVLWVDVRTGELRMLEYVYRRMPWNLPDNSAEGRVDFRRLPGGTWIIQSWFIGVPLVEVVEGGGERTATRVVGFEEAGGDVRTLTNSAGIRLPDAHAATLHGVVYDSTIGRPRAGVRIHVPGTRLETFTGVAGRYQLVDVPPGTHSVRASHPAWDSLTAASALRNATVQAGSIVPLDVHLPSLPTLLEDRCDDASSTILAGRAHGESTDFAVAGARITARWRDAAASAERVVTSDEAGRFVFCGLPMDVTITIQAHASGLDSLPVEVRLIQGRTRVQRLLSLRAAAAT